MGGSGGGGGREAGSMSKQDIFTHCDIASPILNTIITLLPCNMFVIMFKRMFKPNNTRFFFIKKLEKNMSVLARKNGCYQHVYFLFSRHGLGDCRKPLHESALLVEEIVQQQLMILVCYFIVLLCMLGKT